MSTEASGRCTCCDRVLACRRRRYAAAAGSGPQSQVLHHIVRRRHSLRSTDEMAQFINKLQTKNEQFYSPDIW